MRYTAIADTDIGITRETNQDSVLIKHAATDIGEVLMAIVCDGMGGLSKGELASATVIREFARWFDEELPRELENLDMQIIGGKWALMLKELNARILEYGTGIGASLGTTFSGILMIDDQFVIAHVGDTRIYHLGAALTQLTDDQTFIAREISRGNMTVEQAKTDKRRNMLLQCVGASKVVEPQLICGAVEKGAYLICSDGFRHEITPEEIYATLAPAGLTHKTIMQNNARYLIEQVKSRQERDNISVILIKAE